MLLAALMATQPDSRLSAGRRERNAELLTDVLRLHEHKLRRQALRHAQLPDDVDDALQTAYLRFLERYKGVGEPLAWLYTTVKREAWAIRSRGSRQRERSFNLQSMDPTAKSTSPRRYRVALRGRSSRSSVTSSSQHVGTPWRA